MSRRRVWASTPILVVSDLSRAIAFYERLGYVEPMTWGEPPEFAMLNRDGFDLMLSVGHDAPLPVNAKHGAWDLHLRVADLDAEIAALRAAGATVPDEPRTTFYGMREIEIDDPDGHRICLGQDLEPRDPREKL